MSNGLFQNLPGAHEMGGANALSNEPWLLPISDRPMKAGATPEALLLSVRQSARPFRIAANALCAVLALILTAQITTGIIGSSSNPSTGQIADASPPTIAVEKAALTVHH